MSVATRCHRFRRAPAPDLKRLASLAQARSPASTVERPDQVSAAGKFTPGIPIGFKDFTAGLDNRPLFCNSNCDHRSRQAGQSALLALERGRVIHQRPSRALRDNLDLPQGALAARAE
jgi:hypothetical protein